ncbi:MAG: hypothetical protein ACP5IZ_10780, partial [Thermoprotei archaeon]
MMEYDEHFSTLSFPVAVGDYYIGDDFVQKIRNDRYGIDNYISGLELFMNEINNDLDSFRKEKNTLEEELNRFNEIASKLSQLQVEIKQLQDNINNQTLTLNTLSRFVDSDLKKHNISEAEARSIIEKKIRSKKGKLKNIEEELAEKERILKEQERRYEELLKDEERRVAEDQEYASLKKEYDSMKSEIEQKRKRFMDTFKACIKEAIPQEEKFMLFDDIERGILRSVAFSSAERLFLAHIFQYALVKTLIKLQYISPENIFIVFDVFPYVDEHFLATIVNNYLQLKDVTTIILKTAFKELPGITIKSP